MGGPEGGDVDDGVVIEDASQRSEQIAQVGLGKRIAKSVGKRQEPAALTQKIEDIVNLSCGEKRLWLGYPTLPSRIIAAGWRRDYEQLGLGKKLGQWFFVGGGARATQAAQCLHHAGKVGMHLARREAGLGPVGLSVRCIKQDCLTAE
jgi:hypothetical protein